MNNYIENNKMAWEETFEHKYPNWGDDNHIKLQNEELPFLNQELAKELKKMELAGKTVAQFCCNNGRELLSVMQLGVESGVGFDIAENIIEQAKETAKSINENKCEFVACNILNIDESFYNKFDFIFFTIGAITWFENLNLLFDKVSQCLKKNGKLLINESHPFMNMLPVPGEDKFDSNHLNQISYSYFREEPWIENSGIGYISPKYDSKTFTSFSHTMSHIINSIGDVGMSLEKLYEYDYDIGLSKIYDGMGYPLSFTLIAKK